MFLPFLRQPRLTIKTLWFPVENENWSSQLTADDIESKEVVDNGSSYVITLNIKADEPSTDTAHGNGHNGKVFSVVMPSIVTDNAGPAASIIKDVKTGHSDGYVKITVDKASGKCYRGITYYFVWTLSLTALSKNVSIPFGLEKNFTIALVIKLKQTNLKAPHLRCLLFFAVVPRVKTVFLRTKLSVSFSAMQNVIGSNSSKKQQ